MNKNYKNYFFIVSCIMVSFSSFGMEIEPGPSRKPATISKSKSHIRVPKEFTTPPPITKAASCINFRTPPASPEVKRKKRKSYKKQTPEEYEVNGIAVLLKVIVPDFAGPDYYKKLGFYAQFNRQWLIAVGKIHEEKYSSFISNCKNKNIIHEEDQAKRAVYDFEIPAINRLYKHLNTVGGAEKKDVLIIKSAQFGYLPYINIVIAEYDTKENGANDRDPFKKKLFPMSESAFKSAADAARASGLKKLATSIEEAKKNIDENVAQKKLRNKILILTFQKGGKYRTKGDTAYESYKNDRNIETLLTAIKFYIEAINFYYLAYEESFNEFYLEPTKSIFSTLAEIAHSSQGKKELVKQAFEVQKYFNYCDKVYAKNFGLKAQTVRHFDKNNTQITRITIEQSKHFDKLRADFYKAQLAIANIKRILGQRKLDQEKLESEYGGAIALLCNIYPQTQKQLKEKEYSTAEEAMAKGLVKHLVQQIQKKLDDEKIIFSEEFIARVNNSTTHMFRQLKRVKQASQTKLQRELRKSVSFSEETAKIIVENDNTEQKPTSTDNLENNISHASYSNYIITRSRAKSK